MSEDQGWIKLHRKSKQCSFYKNPEAFLLWCHLLLSVNHKEKTFMHGNQIITLRPGQILTGRKSLSVDTGIHELKVKRLLDVFESEHQIEQQKTNKFSIITVLRWDDYQINEQQNEQQMNNKRTTDEQQMNTNKNEKNEKNEKEDLKEKINKKKNSTSKPSGVEEVKTYAQEIELGSEQAEAFYDHFESNGWKVGGKTPMKDWKAALRNWKRNARPQPISTAPAGSQPQQSAERERPTKRQMLFYALNHRDPLYKVNLSIFTDYQEKNGWPGDWRQKLHQWYLRCMENENNPARRFLTLVDYGDSIGFREFAGAGTGQVQIHEIYGIRLPLKKSEFKGAV